MTADNWRCKFVKDLTRADRYYYPDTEVLVNFDEAFDNLMLDIPEDIRVILIGFYKMQKTLGQISSELNLSIAKINQLRHIGISMCRYSEKGKKFGHVNLGKYNELEKVFYTAGDRVAIGNAHRIGIKNTRQLLELTVEEVIEHICKGTRISINSLRYNFACLGVSLKNDDARDMLITWKGYRLSDSTVNKFGRLDINTFEEAANFIRSDTDYFIKYFSLKYALKAIEELETFGYRFNIKQLRSVEGDIKKELDAKKSEAVDKKFNDWLASLSRLSANEAEKKLNSALKAINKALKLNKTM